MIEGIIGFSDMLSIAQTIGRNNGLDVDFLTEIAALITLLDYLRKIVLISLFMIMRK
ncbi:MAG: hypothetical protein ACJ72F_06540 [Nitrososphaeraceae archaeon]